MINHIHSNTYSCVIFPSFSHGFSHGTKLRKQRARARRSSAAMSCSHLRRSSAWAGPADRGQGPGKP